MRPIVAVREDGSMAGWFESYACALKKYNLHKGGIWKSIKTGKPYKGFRWVYKEVYDKHYKDCTLHELSFKRDYSRDSNGYWVKGHKGVKFTEETKQRIAKHARKQSYRQAHDKNSNWGKPRYRRVWCVNNNKEYSSITEAASELGLTQKGISSALYGGHKTKGYKFYKIIKK